MHDVVFFFRRLRVRTASVSARRRPSVASRWRFWKATTAARVRGPKMPSAATRSFCCSHFTCAPLDCSLSTGATRRPATAGRIAGAAVWEVEPDVDRACCGVPDTTGLLTSVVAAQQAGRAHEESAPVGGCHVPAPFRRLRG
jgi:hypothetical protein